MKNYSVFTLRPHQSSEREEFNDFRRSDVENLARVFAIIGILQTVFIVAKYIITRESPDEVISKIIAYSVAMICVSILPVLKSSQ